MSQSSEPKKRKRHVINNRRKVTVVKTCKSCGEEFEIIVDNQMEYSYVSTEDDNKCNWCLSNENNPDISYEQYSDADIGL